jgi:hypothetical protein
LAGFPVTFDPYELIRFDTAFVRKPIVYAKLLKMVVLRSVVVIFLFPILFSKYECQLPKSEVERLFSKLQEMHAIPWIADFNCTVKGKMTVCNTVVPDFFEDMPKTGLDLVINGESKTIPLH